MADVALNETLEVVVVDGATNNGSEMVVNSDGTVNTRLKDGSGNTIVKGQATMANSLPIVIASDQSTVPVSVGLPTFLDKTFGYATGINQPTSGTDNPLILIKNPNASGKTVYFSFISYGIAVANVFGVLRAYRNPTITSDGTSKTIIQFGSSSTVLSLYEVPTISANGTLLGTAVCGQNSNSFINQINFEVTVAANSNLLITGNPSSNNRQAEITIRWIEI